MLFSRICASMHTKHAKWRGPDPEHTLNRLFREQAERERLPYLSTETVTIAAVSMPLAELQALAQPRMSRRTPKRDEPVVIVRFDGVDYLIDGSKRVHHAARIGRDPVPAYVLTVRPGLPMLRGGRFALP